MPTEEQKHLSGFSMEQNEFRLLLYRFFSVSEAALRKGYAMEQ